MRDTSGFLLLNESKFLLAASNHHLKYCLKQGSLKHQEKSKKFKTVVNRVEHYGGNNGYVNEIITKRKMVKNATPDVFADELLLTATKTVKNRKIFLLKNLAEIGVSVGERNGYLYAVFVLGSKEIFTNNVKTPNKLYGMKGITVKNKPVCDACRSKFNKMPKEVSYDVFQKEGKVFFVMSSQEWFAKVFSEKKDGITVDIMRKAQFSCGIPNVLNKSNLFNGYVLPPVYAKDFTKKAYINDYEEVVVPLGEIPEEWREDELEINLMILQQNIVCRYNTFFRVPFEDWAILNLDFREEYVSGGELVSFSEKEMSFEIPFEKGKYTFDSLDIKPLVDSLRLTDYKIDSIKIIAYSSIEGLENENLVLQENRAQSIVNAIKSYDKGGIGVSVNSTENWVEFFTDIEKTPQGFLLKKSKEEIREYVNGHLTNELEEILNNHRKANIEITLKRREVKTDITQGYLEAQLAKNERETPYILLDIILNQEIENEGKIQLLNLFLRLVSSSSYYSQEFEGALLIQEYLLRKTDLDFYVKRLIFLNEQNPLSFNLRYNLVILELEKWFQDGAVKFPEGVKSRILSMNYISQEQKNRLLINFHILETARFFKQKMYREKDASIREVVRLSAKTKLDDHEAFIVARFYADYKKYKEAINILKPYVYRLNVNEDLLFLYINLTIIDNNAVRQGQYRTALTNASQSNKERFCNLFNSSSTGGITFQLLENKYLKRTYCEQCD